jgi:hypothetical protein
MTLTEDIEKLIESRLSEAGFSVAEDYTECAEIKNRAANPAFWRIKEISLGEMLSGADSECSADFTAEVRMFGKKCGFKDRAELIRSAEKFASALIFSSTAIVRNLKLSDVRRDLQLGRLEYTVTATLSIGLKKGD